MPITQNVDFVSKMYNKVNNIMQCAALMHDSYQKS